MQTWHHWWFLVKCCLLDGWTSPTEWYIETNSTWDQLPFTLTTHIDPAILDYMKISRWHFHSVHTSSFNDNASRLTWMLDGSTDFTGNSWSVLTCTRFSFTLQKVTDCACGGVLECRQSADMNSGEYASMQDSKVITLKDADPSCLLCECQLLCNSWYILYLSPLRIMIHVIELLYVSFSGQRHKETIVINNEKFVEWNHQWIMNSQVL